MPDLLPLRPYQREAIDAIRSDWYDGYQRLALVLATGAGKTVVLAHLIAEQHDLPDHRRSLVLVHRDELVSQSIDKLSQVAPHLKAGIVKAERNEVDADVVVASVQTLSKRARLEQLVDVGLVVVDECFPAGTLVGGTPIEALRSGDVVPSWDEGTGRPVFRRVVATMKRRPESMVRVTFVDGSVVHCTPNHPFMTTSGWTPAWRLRGAHVLSFPHHASTSSSLFSDVFGVWNRVHKYVEEQTRPTPWRSQRVLLEDVFGEKSLATKFDPHDCHEPEVRIGPDESEQPDATRRCEDEGVSLTSSSRAQSAQQGWKRDSSSRATASSSRHAGMADRSRHRTEGRREAVPLQGGYRPPVDEGAGRSRRSISQCLGTSRSRRTTRRAPEFARVVDVQVLEPGRDGTYGGVCPDGHVYNIEVESTHTYLVGNGVVAHNCHHAAAQTYQDVLHGLGCFDPDSGVAMLGVTATLARSDEKNLAETIEKVAYSRDILELVQEGYLVSPRGRQVKVDGMDLSEVRLTRGDFSEADLADELDDAGAAEVVAHAYREHAAERQGLLFAPTIASAHVFAEELSRVGVKAEPAWGTMPLEDRRALLKRFAHGDVQVVCNAQIFTEGTDLPFVSCVVVARPTHSAPLYVQMVGRALRPHPGKNDALVLDVVGASGNHRLANITDLSSRTRDKEIEIIYGEETEEISLLEAIDKAYRDKRKGASGKLTYDDVDLFAASKSAWLQTHKGLWFIPNQHSIYFLYPDPDNTYRVVQRTKSGGYARLKEGLSLSYAMAWAETYSNEEDENSPYSIAGRQAVWRRKKAKPTPAQVSYAQEIGLDLVDGASKAELSDMISVHKASKAIDRWVRD